MSAGLAERVLVDAPADRNQHGPRRALGPSAVRDIRARFDAGAGVGSLAQAYEVSIRTIYRYVNRRAAPELVECELDGYVARFILPIDGPPQQVSPWRART